MIRRLPAALLLLSFAFAPAFAEDAKPAAPAAPPVSAEPQTTTADYGDWVLRCQHVNDAGKSRKICEIVESFQSGEQQKQTVAQVALGRVAKTDPMHVTVHLIPNVSFPSVVKLALGDKDPKPMELAWRRCAPIGCFADLALTEAQVKALHAQTDPGSIEFTDSVGRPVKFAVSFRGLAQALDALDKE